MLHCVIHALIERDPPKIFDFYCDFRCIRWR